ncbi:ornithine carbamoyltransferase [Staphylococcus massiliensis]|uniref:Ornithine carbamoyltransferase n=1 Tax=Staphylococcus massiliensis S46 TaxID=1229783 RepID=K9ANY6_9STAP|nr:ornithine carbamoyltransferase [Staphylococcus massiliensis]EKU49024.1 ornithine carbamoyltransferase [Staphylococcus massiliensis S46]MCG3399466.1 ornithine carbamoyltransferase [Staphylococcus massiliensis]MCG3411602.1 ornithine carbamoyltransferase [Staphylococcus massiliensis]PNZ99499.1 ornithine carbamoyltransferase [Staphylococcus massiliensis CCUG 55927]
MTTYTTSLHQLNQFKGKSFLKTMDYTGDELLTLIDFSMELKDKKQRHIPHRYLEGKNIALIFQKPSTRTRCAFTVAARDMGAFPQFLGEKDLQLGTKESAEDTAKVLGRMFDGIEYRGFKQSDVEDLAQHSGVPVWNGLTDDWHPTQMLADFMTLKEKLGALKGKTLTYVGDSRNNVAHSLLIAGSLLGVNIHIAAPTALQPKASVVEKAKSFASESGSHILITDDIEEAVQGTDALYTDVWVSMGEDESVVAERIELLKPYQVNQSMIDQTKNPDVLFLHCLPACHDLKSEMGEAFYEKFGMKELEVTDEVFRSKHSVVFDQAENRLHTIKSVMAATLGDIY